MQKEPNVHFIFLSFTIVAYQIVKCDLGKILGKCKDRLCDINYCLCTIYTLELCSWWVINNSSDNLTDATNWNGTAQTQAIYISQCREKVIGYFL